MMTIMESSTTDVMNSLPVLMPGDIIFSVKMGHAAMSIGGDKIIQAVPPFVESLTLSQMLDSFIWKFCKGIKSICRVSSNYVSDNERVLTAQYALSQLGVSYIPWDVKFKTPSWSCLSLLWKSWLEGTGGRIDLSPVNSDYWSNYFINNLTTNPYLDYIYGRGN